VEQTRQLGQPWEEFRGLLEHGREIALSGRGPGPRATRAGRPPTRLNRLVIFRRATYRVLRSSTPASNVATRPAISFRIWRALGISHAALLAVISRAPRRGRTHGLLPTVVDHKLLQPGDRAYCTERDSDFELFWRGPCVRYGWGHILRPPFVRNSRSASLGGDNAPGGGDVLENGEASIVMAESSPISSTGRPVSNPDRANKGAGAGAGRISYARCSKPRRARSCAFRKAALRVLSPCITSSAIVCGSITRPLPADPGSRGRAGCAPKPEALEKHQAAEMAALPGPPGGSTARSRWREALPRRKQGRPPAGRGFGAGPA